MASPAAAPFVPPKENPIQATIAAQSSLGWETLWTHSHTPWDRGQANPYLCELLAQSELVRGLKNRVGPKGRGLVGGCGRGYDVEAIARLTDWDCWGVDLSETAMGEARKWFASLPPPTDADKSGHKTGEVSYHAVDFFKFDVPEGAFDLAFDATFLCALPPSLRPAWSKRYLSLLPTPGSLLVTLVWPMQPPAERAEGKGPPWGVTLEDYEGLLVGEKGEGGWKKVYEGEGGERGRVCAWERL